MNSGILFGFKDLVNSTSQSISIFDLSSIIFNDSYLKSLSPKRYNFYVKFVNGLSKPEVLEKFFYKTKEAKLYKQELNEKILNFVNILKKLNTNISSDEITKISDNISNNLKDRFNLTDDATNKIKDMIKAKKGGFYKGEQPMRQFIDTVNTNMPELNQPPRMRSVEDLASYKPQTVDTAKTETVKKAKSIYDTYKDTVNPALMEIKMIDRVVFIITTFLIRYISLLFIDWGLSTNLINSFHYAFFYYSLIYLILFLFITMFVNVIISYPIMELFTNSSIADIPNLFYYFYIYANGYIRLLIHIICIIILLFIPYIINIDKLTIIQREEKQSNISFNYDKKKKVYDSISTFSLIIWILTSIIALKF
jgi:hypothetical protein